LLFAALACLLAFAPRTSRLPAIVAALIAAAIVAQVPLPPRWVEGVFLGCWASTVATAALVHFPGRLTGRRSLALGVNAGAWAGATVAIAGTTLDLAEAAPWLVLVAPGAWLVATRRGVAVKVVSSWLIAIALLAAVLPLVPTPGYAPDHME
jgi:hypothetical protein